MDTRGRQVKERFDVAQVIMETVETHKEGSQLVITISDNGCGMNKVTQESIFEPFYTTKDISSGTGLGMSVSLEVIEAHQGSISVSSELEQGSTIIIQLPIGC